MNLWGMFKNPVPNESIEDIVDTILRSQKGRTEFKVGARERIIKKFENIPPEKLSRDEVVIDRLAAAFEEENLYGKLWD